MDSNHETDQTHFCQLQAWYPDAIAVGKSVHPILRCDPLAFRFSESTFWARPSKCCCKWSHVAFFVSLMTSLGSMTEHQASDSDITGLCIISNQLGYLECLESPE